MELKVECASCAAEIDGDSCYCDQCGKEIFLCSICFKPVDGNFCDEDAGETFSAAVKAGPYAVNSAAPGASHTPGATMPIPAAPGPAPVPAATPVTAFTPPSGPMSAPAPMAAAPAVPKLRLLNPNLNLDLPIEDGLVIGRTTGKYLSHFGQFATVSGQHVAFFYRPDRGWVFKDLNSTNLTKYSAINRGWDALPGSPPQVEVSMKNKHYLLIANVEFQIELEETIAPVAQSTQRI